MSLFYYAGKFSSGPYRGDTMNRYWAKVAVAGGTIYGTLAWESDGESPRQTKIGRISGA